MVQIDKYWDKIHLQYNSTYDNWLNKYVHLFSKNSRIVELDVEEHIVVNTYWITDLKI